MWVNKREFYHKRVLVKNSWKNQQWIFCGENNFRTIVALATRHAFKRTFYNTGIHLITSLIIYKLEIHPQSVYNTWKTPTIKIPVQTAVTADDNEPLCYHNSNPRVRSDHSFVFKLPKPRSMTSLPFKATPIGDYHDSLPQVHWTYAGSKNSWIKSGFAYVTAYSSWKFLYKTHYLSYS